MSISKYFVRNVATTKESSNIDDAIEVMRAYGAHDVVVVENKGGKPFPLGILSCHDIAMKAFGKKASGKDLFVRDIMTRNPITCEENHGIYETIDLMQQNDVKRLPVVDEDGALIGIVTASDLFGILSEELSGLTKRTERPNWRKKGTNAQTAIV